MVYPLTTMTFFSNEGRKRRKKETNSKSRPTPYPQQPNQQKISYPPNLPSPPSTAQLPYYRQQGPYHTHYANPSTPNLRPSPGPVNSRSNLRETLTNQAGKSVTQLRTKTSQFLDSRGRSCQALNSGAALCDIISSKLDAIITSIDDERFSGTEQDLQFPSAAHDAYHGAVGAQYSADAAARSRGMFGTNLSPANANSLTTINSVNGAGGRRGSNHFAKVWLYTNSRLPPHLPPFKVYVPSTPFPLSVFKLLAKHTAYPFPATSPPGP